MSLLSSLAKKILPASVFHQLLAWRALSRGHNPELRLLPLLESGGLFIDVGANIGDYSRVAARHYKCVMAFEPQPDLIRKLRSELPENVVIYPFALSDRQQTATLYVPSRYGEAVTGLSSLDMSYITHDHDGMNTIECETKVLDNYGFRRVDTIKIDVEGFEISVLKGSLNTIRDSKPALIVEIEDRPHYPYMLPFEFLLAEGYLAFYYLDRGLFPIHMDYVDRRSGGKFGTNFIFLHKDRVTLTEDVTYDGKYLARLCSIPDNPLSGGRVSHLQR